MVDKKVIGKMGEDEAAKYLKERGYRILERNWRSRFGEIDIVAELNSEIYFVEVKTKTSERYGAPWEMATGGKLRQVRQMAEAYLVKRGWTEKGCHLLVVSVRLGREGKAEGIEKFEVI